MMIQMMNKWTWTSKKKLWIPETKYRRQNNRIKKEPITNIFNNSSVKLTKPMENLITRGLNFAILPLNLDLTHRFERSFVWTEFWYWRGSEEPYQKQKSKTNKTNFLKNYNAPNWVKTYVNSVRSELFDYKNRNKSKKNIPPEEVEALSQLIKLQRERKIIIKPSVKGAGVLTLDFVDYIEACKDQLESEQKDTGGNNQKYYLEVGTKELEEAK